MVIGDNGLKKPIFVVGSERSGTTIIGLAIRDGARIKGYPEGHLLPLMDSLIEEINRYYGEREDLLENSNLMIAHIKRERLVQGFVTLFRDLVDSLFQDNIWIDKTPGGRMIKTSPHLLNAWPEAHIIFAKRRGIECLISRLKKFPKISFENHCKMWGYCMSCWLEVREKLKGHYIEVDQREISMDPEGAAYQIGTFINLDSKQMGEIQKIFSDKRPQSTGGVESDTAIDISEAGWTDDQINIFRKHCSPVFEKFGYSESSSYYL